jgi:hypothetical protein
MKSKVLVKLSILYSVAVCVSFNAASAQKGTTNTNLTTVVFDLDGTSQLLMRSDDYNSSLCGGSCAVYSASLNPNVQTYISSTGAWRLDLFNQSVRRLYVTPDIPYGTEPAGPPPGYYWENLETASLCFDANNNAVPFPNVVTSSSNCSLNLDFTANGTKYKLFMGPSLPSAACPASGCPGTGLLTVTCNAVTSGQCTNWTINPTAGLPKSTVANLYYYGHKGLVFIGQYYNTFLIKASNP